MFFKISVYFTDFFACFSHLIHLNNWYFFIFETQVSRFYLHLLLLSMFIIAVKTKESGSKVLSVTFDTPVIHLSTVNKLTLCVIFYSVNLKSSSVYLLNFVFNTSCPFYHDVCIALKNIHVNFSPLCSQVPKNIQFLKSLVWYTDKSWPWPR